MLSAKEFAKNCSEIFHLSDEETNMLNELILLRDADIEASESLRFQDYKHDTIVPDEDDEPVI